MMMIIIIIVIIECLGSVRPWVLWRSTELELSLERFLNPGGLITYKDTYNISVEVSKEVQIKGFVCV